MNVSDRLQENYAHYYENSDSQWRWLTSQDKAANVMSLCRDIPHSTICDIGAGEGSLLQRLGDAAFGDKHFALEISQTGIEAIRQRSIGTLVECRLFDGYTIPYPDRFFDLAFLSHVVEHVEHPRRLLNEAGSIANYKTPSVCRRTTGLTQSATSTTTLQRQSDIWYKPAVLKW